MVVDNGEEAGGLEGLSAGSGSSSEASRREVPVWLSNDDVALLAGVWLGIPDRDCSGLSPGRENIPLSAPKTRLGFRR